MLKQAYSSISRIQPCHQHTLRQEDGCTRITASTLATTWFFMSSSTTSWKSADCYIKAEILSRLSGRFLSAKARRKFDAGLLTLPDVVDAKPAQKLYRYRKVPDAARAPAAAYELYREFRTNRRPLNVASVVSRTVEQETSSVPAPRETGGIGRFGWGFDAWVVCWWANGYHNAVTASTP